MDNTAKTKVVLFEPDLLFSSKISAVADKLDISLEVVQDFAELSREEDVGRSRVFIISLDFAEGKTSGLRKYVNEGVNVIAYHSHVKVHLAEEARLAGVQTVLSRGAFASKVEEILMRIARSG